MNEKKHRVHDDTFHDKNEYWTMTDNELLAFANEELKYTQFYEESGDVRYCFGLTKKAIEFLVVYDYEVNEFTSKYELDSPHKYDVEEWLKHYFNEMPF